MHSFPAPARWLLTIALVATSVPARAQTDSASTPPALHWENLAFDAAHQRLVLFGGMTLAGTYLTETWTWNGARWTRLADSASSPGPRHAHAMTYDAATSRVMLFGGMRDMRDASLPPAERERPLCDTWSLSDSTWTSAADTTCPIAARAAATLVARDARGALILVEGVRASRDMQPLPMRLWRRDSTAWTLLDSAGPRRPLDASGAVAYDVARSVLVVPVLGGPDDGVWEWDGTSWRHARVETGPPPRRNYAIAYDSRRRRVALIGGLASAPRRPLGDHWTWDGATWSEVAAMPVQPSARSHATLVNDAPNGRLLYFGGSSEEGLQRELWIFDAAGWRLWQPAPSR